MNEKRARNRIVPVIRTGTREWNVYFLLFFWHINPEETFVIFFFSKSLWSNLINAKFNAIELIRYTRPLVRTKYLITFGEIISI